MFLVLLGGPRESEVICIMQEKIGLIGVGNVGARLAARLLEAGAELHVYDKAVEGVVPLVAKGAISHRSAASLAATVDVVILSLPTSDIVDSVVLGDDGILSVMRDEAILIDMSTSLPARTLRIVRQAQDRRIRVLDAPLSFGPDGMVIFVGGELETYEEVKPIFDIVGSRSFLVGPSGHGHFVKLAQNLISGVFICAVAEAVAYGKRAGLDLEKMWDALRTTGAQSSVVENTMPHMIDHAFGNSGTLAMHLKDMNYALSTGAQMGARMPFAKATQLAFEGALEHGDRSWTQTAVVTWFEEDVESG